MKLEKIASQPVVALNPGDTLNNAIQQMWRLGIEHLPVVRNGLPVGMLSERDLLLHACGDNYAVHELTHKRLKAVFGTSRVDDIMSAPIVSLSPDDPVGDAARLMLRENIHAIPLVAMDSIVGIVTEKDILKCFVDEQAVLLCEEFRKGSVADQMIAHVFSVHPNDLKPEVIRLMRDKQIRHVPVVNDEDVVVGVIAESDVLRGYRRDKTKVRLSMDALEEDRHSRVVDIMSKNPEVLGLSDTLRDAARVMVANNIGCVPITDGSKLVGIVTNTDLIRAFVHSCV